MARSDGRTRAGFTLIELLVVVTIIGILASILVVAVYRAVSYANAAARKAEVTRLAQAIEMIVISEGQGRVYPPDFTDQARARAYMFKRWPRISQTEVQTVINLNLTPAQALVFWLMGTSPDPVLPFTGPGGPLNNPTAGYEFDTTLIKNDPKNASSAIKCYCPRGSDVPYVYFAARPGMAPASVYAGTYDLTSNSAGIAVPYQRDNNQGFCNPQSFQIISAGVDNDYGTGAARYYPSGTGYTRADDDNIVNFNESPTLSGDKP